MVSPGILLVDKPGGLTSHDVVARTRRALGTRKVGHAGTLDPMATGLLVLGIEGATRLLTYIVGADKTYLATIRLGQASTTDDAEGEITVRASAEDVDAVTPVRLADGIAALTGPISQVPSSVSAIKVDGRRAYDRVRAGEEVELKARAVTVSRFEVLAERRGDGLLDLDVVVDCSSGTYIRALARDLGEALGVGGHLTALRRTRVGPFDVADAADIESLEGASTLTAAEAAARVLDRLDVSAQEARDLRHGKRLVDHAERLRGRQAAAIDEDGVLVGVVERRGRDLKSAMNMPEETR
ncbi:MULTISPECIES: tRNA pseudouridine(55) synthase TruB [unclassified Microbacterium]|uniref:tRNA pseudouridine(55) synthase TruB n=1 Tax=unclassified Microbacterium TaxID=2609290 RepID=UPI001DD8CD58|nr:MULTISPECIES: tRNA pseudouridine(55) synthase TruB [unclassified Microbacterium]CAH0186170.1 tRNA pseudouridine synthase B [Microbacterium sp. Bi121]HWK77394.1 tRNA pseudouridine(55) synthase TruB [Microbacterium sp.]